MEAVGDGDLEKVRELLEAGTDVNIPDDKQRSALHVCCTKNDHEVIKRNGDALLPYSLSLSPSISNVSPPPSPPFPRVPDLEAVNQAQGRFKY